MRTFTLEQFRRWGARGGRKSRRVLTSKQARAMSLIRWSRRNKVKVIRATTTKKPRKART